MIRLYRTPIDVTGINDTLDRYELGPLRASIFGIRVPIRLARWFMRLS